MLKQFSIYLLLSLLVVVFAHYFYRLVISIDMLYLYADHKLVSVFNQTGLGLTIRKTLVLFLLPLAITAVPALLYQVIRGGTMPHYFSITWMIWTVIVLSNVLVR